MFGLLTALAAGCGKTATPLRPNESYPTRGRVVTADGQPFRFGRIVLVPKGAAAPDEPETFGHVKEDGTFQIDTRHIKPGPYDVYLLGYNPSIASDPLPSGITPSEIPLQFQNPKTARLTVAIKEGENDLGLVQLKAGEPPAATVQGDGDGRSPTKAGPSIAT